MRAKPNALPSSSPLLYALGTSFMHNWGSSVLIDSPISCWSAVSHLINWSLKFLSHFVGLMLVKCEAKVLKLLVNIPEAFIHSVGIQLDRQTLRHEHNFGPLQPSVYSFIHPSIQASWAAPFNTALIYSYVRLLQCSLVYIHYGNGTRCVRTGHRPGQTGQSWARAGLGVGLGTGVGGGVAGREEAALDCFCMSVRRSIRSIIQ